MISALTSELGQITKDLISLQDKARSGGRLQTHALTDVCVSECEGSHLLDSH